MLRGIDHVAIKVERIDTVRAAFETQGYACTGIGRYDEVGMNIAFLVCGDSRLELLEVFSDDSPAADSPFGLHHIGIKAPDIEAVFKQMSRDDRYLVQGTIRQGAHARIFFYRIKDDTDTLYECVEAVEAS